MLFNAAKIFKYSFICLLIQSPFTFAQDLPTSVPGASHFIKIYPQSDLNKDGILTHQEKNDFCIQRISQTLGQDYMFEKVMVPMRDGVKLASGIFRPKKPGRYTVILTRTSYGIMAAGLHGAGQFTNKNIVYIAQDLRGDGESEGKETLDPMSFDNEINDGYDAVEWIAKQPFSNGNVGMAGQSGHGFAAYMSYLAKPPALKSIFTTISGGNAYLYWGYHNGVRREMINWFTNRSTKVPQWPKPTIRLFDQKAYNGKIKAASIKNETIFIAQTGWYDIFAESALDYFESFAKDGKVFIQVDASGHGRMAGKPFPNKSIPAEWQIPDLTESTENSEKVKAQKSRMVYYLMGDVTDPNAPGNTYKVTSVWPVPHTPVSYYMHGNGMLSTKKPFADESLSFKYDPRNPVPSVGGDVFIHQGVGPKDQRVLKDRKDILRFTSKPLTEPLEITGKVLAELYIKTDVEDTTFTAKLINIYPDGYEAVVRDSIIMGRFHEGFDKESKLKKGKVYKLKMDMWSTALVVNKGHRIAVHISSSNSPKYEVHPNTFEPVSPTDFTKAPIATNTIILSKEHSSKIILPVVK